MTNFISNPYFDFSEEEFNNAKSRDMLKCHCTYCGNPIYMAKHYIQTKIKNNSLKFFCDTRCAGNFINTSIKTTCTNCGKEISIVKGEYEKSKSHHFFCSKSCNATYNNKHRKTEEERAIIKEKAKERARKRSKIKRLKNHICHVCGQNVCKHPEICKSSFFRSPSNLIKIGFDMSVVGSEKVYDEYERIKNYLNSLYHEQKLSYPDICKMHNIPKENTIMLMLNFFGIKHRTFSESSILSFEQGKIKVPKLTSDRFKSGYHTTWDNKEVFYRSSYELDYMNKLDAKQIPYEVEKLRIKYYNTVKKRYAIAIPDFYLPDTNTIIEVKSRFTYIKKEMIDKMNEYKKLGYNFVLLYEHKKYNDCTSNEYKCTIKDFL